MSRYLKNLYGNNKPKAEPLKKDMHFELYKQKLKKSNIVGTMSTQAFKPCDSGDESVVLDDNIIDGSQTGQYCTLACRSIRIGNYKVLPKEKIIITERGVQVKVPAILNPNDVVTLNIMMQDVLKVLAHFGKSMPLLFLYVSPSACIKIRSCLKMTNKQSFFLDVQTSDETQKRITILPDKLTEDQKSILKTHFGANVQELEAKDANEILVRSSPKDLQCLKSKMIETGMTIGNIGASIRTVGQPGAPSSSQEQQVVKYCQYPPDGSGMVSVTNEDYNCLEAEQFLNDVIIDFYLKYLQFGEFKSIDQMLNRTHIFTTYFYKRLTTRPNGNSKGKAHPVEDNPNLSAADKRYDRVKKWTKKVDLFSKDFIIVPINEHAHWFVCIICFPGQNGCQRFEDGTPCETPPPKERSRKAKRKSKKGPLTIGSTTIIPLKGSGGPETDIRYTLEDDGSDRDEAEASDDDMEDEEEVEKKPDSENGDNDGGSRDSETNDGHIPLRRPCILIFDSLKGSSKARTCQTLRDYLTCEWKAKQVSEGKEERVFSTVNMPGCGPAVQQQPNFSDCGIYLLQYVQSFFRDPIQDYSLPIKGLRQWFPKEEVEGKRAFIAELIRNLAEKQNPGKDFHYPDLNFTNPPEEGEEESEEEEGDEYDGGDGEVEHLRSSQGPPNSTLVRVGGGHLVAQGHPGPPQHQSHPGMPGLYPGRSQIMQGPPGPPGPGGPTQGKVLISKMGKQLTLTSLGQQSMPMVPPGVTVTPAQGRPQIRKMSGMGASISTSGGMVSLSGPPGLGAGPSLVGSMGQGQLGHMVQAQGHRDSLSTSPDSTSQEPEGGALTQHMVGDIKDQARGLEGASQEDSNCSVPDSQGFESGLGKRSSDSEIQDLDSKRLKSDGSET